MVKIMDALRTIFLDDPRAARSFVTGPADVVAPPFSWAISNEYQPAAYATYPATSNGVYACINVRANNLTSLPLKLYSKKVGKDGKRREITSGPARDLLDNINPFWTFERWLNMTEQSLCVWGESFSFYSKQGNRPTELWWARADQVKVHPHPTEYISHFTYDTGNGHPIRFERDETLWLRFANVANQWEGLSPLAAARLAADTSNAAMRSNHNIFRNGLTGAGMISPREGTNLTQEQASAVASDLNRRFRGVDNAHKIGVLRFGVDIKQLSLSPKDAEFVSMMNLTLEDIARAYNVPIDKIGGRRTYQNVEDSEKVFWSGCIIPEARFIAAEITEQLLPLFGGDMVAEFDTSGISVLHEAESAKWERWQGQITSGARTVNEYRAENGLNPVPWGDVWWAQSTMMPVVDEERPILMQPPALSSGSDQDAEDDDQPDDADPGERRYTRSLAFGSAEHRALMDKRNAAAEPWEQRIGNECARLHMDLQQSVLARLRQRSRSAEQVALDPFDRSRWVKAFRVTMRPVFEGVVAESAELAQDELGVAFAFDVQDPDVLRAIERQAQRFAEEVPETTWENLRDSLRDGLLNQEDIDQLAKRVENVMRYRIRSSKETIARTETTRASTTGTLAGWRQSGVVRGKRWVAALDDRTRPTHIEAHGQEVGLDDMFTVGAASGPGPGDLDSVREVANCRCTVVPVLDVEGEKQ